MTLREHASFVELPDMTTYQPRVDDPRAGYGGLSFVDYSTPIGEPMQSCATSGAIACRRRIRPPR